MKGRSIYIIRYTYVCYLNIKSERVGTREKEFLRQIDTYRERQKPYFLCKRIYILFSDDVKYVSVDEKQE